MVARVGPAESGDALAEPSRLLAVDNRQLAGCRADASGGVVEDEVDEVHSHLTGIWPGTSLERASSGEAVRKVLGALKRRNNGVSKF